MVKLFFLNMFAKNLDSIIALFTKLDAQLDAYIAKEKAEANSLESMILDLREQQTQKQGNIERAARIQSNVKGITQ